METEQIAKALRDKRGELQGRGEANEADTRRLLVDPLLDWLGYPAEFRGSERQDRGNCPDEIIFSRQASRTAAGVQAAIVLEAKPLGTDLDKSSRGRTDAPKRQLKRYLSSHRDSGEGTYGVLTDGAMWYVVRRGDFPRDAKFIDEFDIFSGDMNSNLARLWDLLSRENLGSVSRPVARSKLNEHASAVIAAVAELKPPADIVTLLAPKSVRQVQQPIRTATQLSGKAADAERKEWEATDWDFGCEISDGGGVFAMPCVWQSRDRRGEVRDRSRKRKVAS